MNIYERYAPKGKVWVCPACGRIQPYDRCGDANGSRGWDVSCVLNAVLLDYYKLVFDDRGFVIGYVEQDKISYHH